MRKMAILALMMAGCSGEVSVGVKSGPQPTPVPSTLTTYQPDPNNGKFRVVELEYGGRKHVFLQHVYYSDHQSMVKVGDYPLEEK